VKRFSALQQRIVDYDPHCGARVSALTLRDAHEIYQIRIMLEPLAVESSVARRDDRWLAELADTYGKIDAFYAASNTLEAGAVEAHREFHRVLRKGCESGGCCASPTCWPINPRACSMRRSRRAAASAPHARNIATLRSRVRRGRRAHGGTHRSHLQRTLSALQLDAAPVVSESGADKRV